MDGFEAVDLVLDGGFLWKLRGSLKMVSIRHLENI